jgi:MFS family permease
LLALSLAGFARMGSELWIYYALWGLFTTGYVLSGPIPHQLIVSHWFRRNRGKAIGLVYVGNGLMGSLGSILVKPLTERYGFQAALLILAALILLCWPIAIFVLRDKPSDLGQYPDGDTGPSAESALAAHSFAQLFASRPFWLILIGSFCAIGAVGSINFHLKFVFLDEGFEKGPMADAAWRTSSVLILWSSVAGRLLVGSLADRFSKKAVMTTAFALLVATIPMLMLVRPDQPVLLYVFSVFFGFGLGADYMLIPLIAAEQFGVNSLARAMAVILPANTIGQTWLPYFVSILRDRYGSYSVAMSGVLAIAICGAGAIALLPGRAGVKELAPKKAFASP